MVSYVAVAFLGLTAAYLVNTYRCFATNLAAAKRSGLPYICMPVYTFNRFWLVTHRLWLPFINLLPKSWLQPWIEYVYNQATSLAIATELSENDLVANAHHTDT